MNTDYWASLDQYTSFVKEPWGFNRPENRKEHSLLSKATFSEWPNTTSDFSVNRGVPPPGKLSAPKSSSENRPVHAMVPRSSSSQNIFTNESTMSQERRAKSTTGRTNNTTIGNPRAVLAEARNSADQVTAAYTLWSTHKAPGKNARTTNLGQQHAGREETHQTTSKWSAVNVGFSDTKGEERAHRERENREGYVQAAFASQAADKPYIAEATHFRFRYPHTLGRITSLSHTRTDRDGERHHRGR